MLADLRLRPGDVVGLAPERGPARLEVEQEPRRGRVAVPGGGGEHTRTALHQGERAGGAVVGSPGGGGPRGLGPPRTKGLRPGGRRRGGAGATRRGGGPLFVALPHPPRAGAVYRGCPSCL